MDGSSAEGWTPRAPGGEGRDGALSQYGSLGTEVTTPPPWQGMGGGGCEIQAGFKPGHAGLC